MILDALPDYPRPLSGANDAVAYVIAAIIICLGVIITIKLINKKSGNNEENN